MSQKKIEKFELDFSKTLPYFLDHIDSKMILSNAVLKNVNFKEGSFFTLLPSEVNKENILKLSQGGIISAQPYGLPCHTKSGVLFQPKKVETMGYETCKLIKDHLEKKDQSYLIVENFTKEFNDPHANIKNVFKTSYGEQLYYFLNKNNTLNEILKALENSDEIWYSLALITTIDFGMPNFLNYEYIAKICSQVNYIYTTAYDSEAYIIWKRKIKF